MSNRRNFLKSAAAAGVLGPAAAQGAKTKSSTPDYFKDLGIQPFINAAGTYTTLSACKMRPEVIEAYNYASKVFIRLNDLHDLCAERIAKAVKAEACMITAGAASAMTLGTAACITGMDRSKVVKVPDLTGMKNEVIVQKSHRFGYDHAVRNTGVKFIEVETREELMNAAGPQTAMMLFFNTNNKIGKIQDAEFAQLGKKLNIPTFNDCSADVPPVENLWKWTGMGFDLVTFSGGKGLRGPQSAGVLLGRKDLIAAARLNGWPNSDAIGRGMKVNKEELLAMMVTIESYVSRDHAADWREWEKRCKTIGDAVSKIPSVKAEQFQYEVANAVPHLRVTWDPSTVKTSVKEVMTKMREGTPSIELNPSSTEKELVVGVWMMDDGEDKIVAKRLAEILKSA